MNPRSSLIKIDIDVKVPKKWLKEFIETRQLILKKLGYEIEYITYYKSKHGYHFYFKLKNELKSRKEKVKLQFLLGDDHNRVYFNLLRLKFSEYASAVFDVLFDTFRRRRLRTSDFFTGSFTE